MRVATTIFCCSFVFGFFLNASTVRCDELSWTGKEFFGSAYVRGVQLSADGKSVELVRGQLIEDDGAAAGFSYKPNEEALSDGILALKLLPVKFPFSLDQVNTRENLSRQPTRAFLLVGHTGKSLRATVNGKEVELREPRKAGNYWKQYEIPAEHIIEGENKIALSGDGKLWIARDDERLKRNDGRKPEPQRSFRLVGAQPDTPQMGLGPQGDIAGEYYVRLYFDSYQQSGYLESPLLDAANLTGKSIPPPNVRVREIRVQVDGEWVEDRASVGIGWQSSLDPWVYQNGGDKFGEYRFSESSLRREHNPPRFFHVNVNLRATDPRGTPALKNIVVATEIESDKGWGDRLKLVDQHNLNFREAEYWFLFERLNHPRLAHFRKQYKLDEVVKDCTTEFERMQKLAVWSSQQWTKGHLKDIYPKWDALEILKLHDDGTPIGGFCQQYNIVFLQACESFGMVGRCVSIGAGDHGVNIRSGHEVVEIWSNELNKWVYVDGQAAWYFVDKETRAPLNLLELRERQIAALKEKPFRETEVVVLAKSPYEWKGLKEWPAFCELRMIPHTQFLDGKLPIPLNQGMRGWFWTGHRVWTDDVMPASILYDKRITNPRDWNFTVNQTQFWLTQREKEGELDVRLAHNMPSFEHFVVKLGDGEVQIEKGSNFTWPLKQGENRLQVQAVNKLGVKGPASWAVVKWE